VGSHQLSALSVQPGRTASPQRVGVATRRQGRAESVWRWSLGICRCTSARRIARVPGAVGPSVLDGRRGAELVQGMRDLGSEGSSLAAAEWGAGARAARVAADLPVGCSSLWHRRTRRWTATESCGRSGEPAGRPNVARSATPGKAALPQSSPTFEGGVGGRSRAGLARCALATRARARGIPSRHRQRAAVTDRELACPGANVGSPRNAQKGRMSPLFPGCFQTQAPRLTPPGGSLPPSHLEATTENGIVPWVFLARPSNTPWG